VNVLTGGWMDSKDVICAFDQTKHPDIPSLHNHLKRFRVSRAKYYTTYHPKTDPLTGQPIPFKDLDQYLSQEFTSKVTLRKWLAQFPAEGLKWSKGWLAKRRIEKGLIYAPSQVELRTSQCPTMMYYESVAAAEGGYYGVTRALGYADRYQLLPLKFSPLPSDAEIICDTREQSPIVLPHKTRRDTLSVGDYALAAPHDDGLRLERKSLGDFCGTLSGRKVARKGKKAPAEDSALERFDRELARAQEQNLYVVMMVEASIEDAQRFDYLPQTQWVKASPSYIFHNLRSLLIKYPTTLQCVFCCGRIDMARIMMKTLQLGATQARVTDLQYAYEAKLL